MTKDSVNNSFKIFAPVILKLKYIEFPLAYISPRHQIS